MQAVGGAKEGSRTMCDALLAGTAYLSSTSGNATMADLAKAVRAGAEKAKAMPGVLGRSGYLGDKVVGLPEPGCELAALIFEKLC